MTDAILGCGFCLKEFKPWYSTLVAKKNSRSIEVGGCRRSRLMESKNAPNTSAREGKLRKKTLYQPVWPAMIAVG
ncbi:hypothetical protein B5X24_HaOG202238 [Helicoverpa armigera]|uniref:Uncharacterized protein n=1 Tax=Helicoverpa armigera TaxID=29058 RepID=A0A2W1BTD4_HELAM|nr:hypothetical protein B5X24_HaOG202238 [Helicoverpa armigera]